MTSWNIWAFDVQFAAKIAPLNYYIRRIEHIYDQACVDIDVDKWLDNVN